MSTYHVFLRRCEGNHDLSYCEKMFRGEYRDLETAEGAYERLLDGLQIAGSYLIYLEDNSGKVYREEEFKLEC